MECELMKRQGMVLKTHLEGLEDRHLSLRCFGDLDLLGSVDQPLKVMTDRATGKEYLACDYNRDGDSYR